MYQENGNKNQKRCQERHLLKKSNLEEILSFGGNSTDVRKKFGAGLVSVFSVTSDSQSEFLSGPKFRETDEAEKIVKNAT